MTPHQCAIAIKVCEWLGLFFAALAFFLFVFGIDLGRAGDGRSRYPLATVFFAFALGIRDGWFRGRW